MQRFSKRRDNQRVLKSRKHCAASRSRRLDPSLLGNETNLDAAFHGGEYSIEHRQRLSLAKPRLLAGRQLTPSDAYTASQLKISHDVRFIQIKHCQARVEFHWLDSIEFYSVGRDQFQAISSPS